MSLPQLRVALAACDRRDAALALQALDTTHSAIAPLLVGEKGVPAYDRCAGVLKSIIQPPTPEERKRNNPFAKLLALATGKPK